MALALGAGLGAWLILRFAVSPLVRRVVARRPTARVVHQSAAPAARALPALFAMQLVLNFAPDDLPLIGMDAAPPGEFALTDAVLRAADFSAAETSRRTGGAGPAGS